MRHALFALLLVTTGCKRTPTAAADASAAIDAGVPDAGTPPTVTIAWTVDQSKAQPSMTRPHTNPDPTTHSVPITYTVTVNGTARRTQSYSANAAPPGFDPACSQLTFSHPTRLEIWEVARSADGHGTVSAISSSAETGEHRTTFDTFDLPAVASIRQDADVIAPDGTHTALSCTAPNVMPQRALTPSAAALAGKCKMIALDDTVLTIEGHTSKASAPDVSGHIEHYIALDLKEPLCGGDGEPVMRVQLMSTDDAASKSLDRFAKRTNVTVDGTAFAAMTAHHHEPILIDVKKIAPK